MTRMRYDVLTIFLFFALVLSACASPYKAPDLGGLYNSLVQNESPYRNPVVLIPGLMGSKLVESESGSVVWGAFGSGSVNPNSPHGAKLVSLPMEEGKKLNELKDGVVPAGALDSVVVNFLGYPVELTTYAHILSVLGVGGYRDQQLGEAGVVDYGDRHFTCFQFDYDWRRDIVESAKALDRFVKKKRRYVQQEIEKRFGIKDHDVKFDLVAHSMGGLVARYYLRYGDADLPGDGSLPDVTWAGSRYVDHLVVIGTPNAGSIDALINLIGGFSPSFILSRYPPAVLGTMPSVYQLLPRSRHRPLLNEKGGPVEDILDIQLWKKNKWGLGDPAESHILELLLPNVDSPEKQRAIALDHLEKALNRAKQFSSAMDVPAKPPASLHYFLVAGDAEQTNKTVQFDSTGRLSVVQKGPGDGTVLRSSALMDERQGSGGESRLVSPIYWNQVLFLFSNHLDLTRSPAFTDNLLYFLLEGQRS
ncbi:lipase family alpha/beta hydrolase [Thermodesulfobacteriota bacterium]